MQQISRRTLLVGSGATAVAASLGGCTVAQQPAGGRIGPMAAASNTGPFGTEWNARQPDPSLQAGRVASVAGDYGPVPGERFPLPAAPVSRINSAFLRTRVAYARNEKPGTIVVDPRAHYLYFVEEGGRAMRYGVGVGREGFAWSGIATIHDKQEWPDWYPPKEMVQRQPDLRSRLSPLRGGLGVAGGPGNPLGARAMYLWQDNKDTLFRIHGTTEPWTIGTSASSGCIRMINQDIIDLYARTAPGTEVHVLPPSVRARARVG